MQCRIRSQCGGDLIVITRPEQEAKIWMLLIQPLIEKLQRHIKRYNDETNEVLAKWEKKYDKISAKMDCFIQKEQMEGMFINEPLEAYLVNPEWDKAKL